MGLQASIQSGTGTAALPPGAGAVNTRLREFLAFKLGPEECGLLALTQAGDKAQAQLLLMGSVRPVFVEWLASINHYIDLQEPLGHVSTQSLLANAQAASRTMYRSAWRWLLASSWPGGLLAVSRCR